MKAITEEELIEQFQMLLDGKEAYLFVRMNQEAEIYKRLDLKDYLTTILKGATIIIKELQNTDSTGNYQIKRESEQEEMKAETGKGEKTAQKPKEQVDTSTKARTTVKRKTVKKTPKTMQRLTYAKLDKGRARALFNAGWPKDEIAKDLHGQNPEEVAAEVDRLEAERNEEI